MKRILIIIAATVLLITSADAQKKQVRNHVIGFYNLENLFDTYNDPVKNDEEFLPEGKELRFIQIVKEENHYEK